MVITKDRRNMKPTHLPRSLLVALLVGAVNLLHAQPHWAYTLGGVGNDHVADIQVDGAGNLYITGEFSGAITFGGQGFQASGGLDLFVAKLDPNGGLIWFRKGGGYGIDRGVKLALDGAGAVAVVGEFMGTADVLGTTLQSAGNTADMFIAKLEASTGNTIWVRQGGGAAGSDRPYAVTFTPNGQVTLAGEFRGTATWDGQQLVSTPDPITFVPSLDIVVAAYSSTGSLLWLQQGAAEYTDRAIELVGDADNDLYLCGQFSDTITFDQTHNNPMYNATFLLKLDAAGNEVWFRRCGGASFNHARDMQLGSDGNLLLTGDLQGTMIFLDSVPNMISGQDPYAFYILKVKTDGELLGHTVNGSQNLISGRSLVERNGELAVLGQFECSWTDMAAIHGEDRFFAVGDEDLFVARYTLANLALIDAQQFGGPQEKLAGQIAAQPNGDLVFTGSFERGLVFPADLDPFPTTPPPFLEDMNLYPYNWYDCNDPLSSTFVGVVSNGLKDGFISKGFVEGRSPYDWWLHTDTICDHELGDVCIQADYQCVDSIIHCGPLYVGLWLEHDVTSFQYLTVGPELDVLWSDGDTTMTNVVLTTGWFSVQVAMPNGCLVRTDSIYVVINPLPAEPLISDDVVVNTAALYPDEIVLCDPDTALVWVANPDPVASYTWYVPHDTVNVPGITCTVDTTGLYYVTAVTAAGCVSSNEVMVYDYPPVPMPALVANITISYPQDTDQNDSIQVCPGAQRAMAFYVEWTVNGVPYTIPYGMSVRYRFNYFGWSQAWGDTAGYHWSPMGAPGWYTDVLQLMVLNAPCLDDTLLFTLTDSIYAEQYAPILVDLQVTGPQLACEGDTVLWNVTCTGCNNWNVSPAAANIQGNDMWVVNDGTYYFSAYVQDTSSGCYAGDQVLYDLINPGVPELFVTPSDGIICPNATATIYTNAVGTNYVWYGPLGPVPNGQPSIVVNEPGEYFMTMTDPMGCELASDPILITGYATPFLNVTPDGVICLNDPNDVATLQVVTTSVSSMVWAAPLSGNSLTQVVNQPGTYSCSVVGCGITTNLTVTVVAGVADAQLLTPGPITMCPGETAVLEGVAGQSIYIWDPGQVYAAQNTVTEAGSYTLTVIDANGCSDTSDPVVVDVIEFAQPAITMGDTICPGDTAVVSASGSGVLTWYADALMQNLLGVGTSLVLTGVQSSSTVFLVQSDSICPGALALPVTVVVEGVPSFVITGPMTGCTGGSAQFTVPSDPLITYTWTTPNGTVSGSAVTLDPIAATDAGPYICTAQTGCAFASDTLQFAVIVSVPLTIGPDTAICPSGSALFELPPGFNDPVWNGSDSLSAFSMTVQGFVTLQATDTIGCVSTDQAYVDVLEFAVPATAQGVSVCAGAPVVLAVSGSGSFTWYTDIFLQTPVGTGATLDLGVPTVGTFYYVVQEENGCSGVPIAVQVVVTPLPLDAGIVGPAIICPGEPFTLLVSAAQPVNAQWTLPGGGTFTGNPYVELNASGTDAGTYTVVPLVGACEGAPLSWTLTLAVPQALDLGPDTAFCVGSSIDLSVPSGFTAPLWSTGSDSSVITVTTIGVYSLEALDANGCTVSDAVVVDMVDCDLGLPTVFTPNGDGQNDSFGINAAGTRSAEMIMYDRFGVLVFEGDLRRQAWNGMNSRTNEPVSEGVYFYVLTRHPYTGEITTHQGYVQVLR